MSRRPVSSKLFLSYRRRCAGSGLRIVWGRCPGENTSYTSSAQYEMSTATSCMCAVPCSLLLLFWLCLLPNLFRRRWSSNGSGKEHGARSASFNSLSSQNPRRTRYNPSDRRKRRRQRGEMAYSSGKCDASPLEARESCSPGCCILPPRQLDMVPRKQCTHHSSCNECLLPQSAGTGSVHLGRNVCIHSGPYSSLAAAGTLPPHRAGML